MHLTPREIDKLVLHGAGFLAQKVADFLGFGAVICHDAIEQDNGCGTLLDLAPHVVERIGCESDQQAEYHGRQRRHHAHAQFHRIFRVIAQMIFRQHVVEEQADQSGR